MNTTPDHFYSYREGGSFKAIALQTRNTNGCGSIVCRSKLFPTKRQADSTLTRWRKNEGTTLK